MVITHDVSLIGARGRLERRRLKLHYSPDEGLWRTIEPCVAVSRKGLARNLVYHRAFRLPPASVFHPEQGPKKVSFMTLSDPRFPNDIRAYPARIPSIDHEAPYQVIAWADALPATGAREHCDEGGIPDTRDPLKSLLQSSFEELSAAISAGGNPYAEALAEGRGGKSAALASYTMRERIRPRFSYAVPSEANLRLIAGFGPLVELGAGAGYWAALLRARGVDVEALDIVLPPANKYHHGERSWTQISIGSHERLAALGDRSLLLVWPPYDQPMAHDALLAYPGDRLIYVGEGHGGCTAVDAFFDLLEADWKLIRRQPLGHCWDRIHDSLFLYQRRAAKPSYETDQALGRLRLSSLQV